ncbi:hypothetical protein F5876DRAFT_72269 [Lentinula aff. lateritia]|uniref:Uncharacterized protein n=1 Tax=Lentinula aff. lateritia TaxID=2804960 RepID=A0ACC1UDL1_9AGAR|nr:hypothetical protein F5876DRAFT_72269 [Lentinula aff. lateritia]
MSSPIDETFGAAYIGIVVAALLLGISVIQGFYYFTHYTHQKDGWILRGLVVGVLVFDFVHQVLITHTGYAYLIKFWQQPAKLRIVIWSLLAEVLFNGLTGFCVQCFLTYRIWKLSGTKVWLTVVVISLVFAEFGEQLIAGPSRISYLLSLACVIAFAVIAFLRGLSVTVNALAVVGDLFIAGILTLLLQRSKTGFRKSDTMINKLTIFAVNTGALTSLCAVASLISIIAAPNTFIYISFFFSMGRLYTNSLLATLNARKMIRDAAEGINTTTGDNISLPCKGRASSSKRSRNLNTNISIQVETTREFLSDLEHGVVRDRHLSDFKHDEVEIEEDLSEVNMSNGDIESNISISSGIECTAV